MQTHRAVIACTGANGEEHVTSVLVQIDDLTADPWHGTIVDDGRRSPRLNAGDAIVSIGAQQAPAR